MSSFGKITRRNFVQRLIVLGVAGSVFPVRVFAAWPGRDTTEYLAAKLKSIVKNTQSARIIGREYLSMAPEEATRQRLVALICITDEHYRRLARARNRTLKKFVLELQQEDFANGRTVNVRGWILSKTEVRLYALAAIIPG